jgi:hypothetical protein
MCGSCLTQAEHVAATAALAVALVKAPAHRFLASAGLVPAADTVGRDARTVAFLRALELDPVSVLGADVVAAADEWAYEASPAAAFRARRAARGAPAVAFAAGT